MTLPFRLERGGMVDRSRPLQFSFNGRRYEGCQGDTLASALLANGVHLVARSFKYHRPRGIQSAGPEEACALVRVGEGGGVLPNVPATMVELYDGLVAASINCWPGVGFDLGAVNNAISALLPAGFYYKTFMWPGSAWMTYERYIRRAAGLGRAPEAADPDCYDKHFDHCDVLVIGGGPAGIAAALAAGSTGARVLLVEERSVIGGGIGSGIGSGGTLEGLPPDAWLARSLRTLGGMPEVRLRTRTTAVGCYDHNLITLLERVTDHLAAPPRHLPRQRLWKVRAKQIVVAAGAVERPLVFANNDLPGVMLAGAARRYAIQYAVRPGQRAIVFTNNDSGHEAAAALADAGIEVAAIVDPRDSAQLPATPDIPVRAGQVVTMARGGQRVREVDVAPLRDGRTGAVERLGCDLLCVSGGWDPAVHLFSQAGGTLDFNRDQHCVVPAVTSAPVRAAGAANGAFMHADCLAQGAAAGLAAARDAGFAADAAPVPMPAGMPLALEPLWEVPCGRRGAKKFVDLQHDVTAADIVLAVREGYVEVEHAKRYTTTGMGVDQGKTGNIIALGILAARSGRTIPQTGTTTFRPPYTPVTIGAIAGREIGSRFDPLRKTPLTDWHVARGAVFEPVGLWRRPLYYPQPGEGMRDAVERECRAVRNGVALLDASTLGKIDIQGRDAVTFLNRVYTNAWDSLALNQCRYGLMLREDGMVFDDGVTSRLGENHYLMTTTSGGADGVLQWLEDWLQCEWRDLKVYLTPVTAHWATLCLTGPQARTVLERAGTDIDCSRDAFPHMQVRHGLVAGIPARVMRVSFTGELSYEVNVAARHGQALWDALMHGGTDFGITPLGTEALHVLRAEKGYIVVGHDTDGTVTPIDLGMAWLVNQKKGDFLGRRALAREEARNEDNRQLVGLLTEDPAAVAPEGSQIVAWAEAGRISVPPVPTLGHVTSSYGSPVLGRSIALAMVRGGRRRKGEKVAIVARGKVLPAEIADVCFYDSKGARLHG